MAITITIFTDLFNTFDQNVLQTINTGSTKIISLVSPLVAACFSLYVTLVLVNYWRGRGSEPLIDFMLKVAGWAAVITAGMNISYYSQYVVPFFNGFGDDIGSALTAGNGMTNSLDQLLSLYVNVITSMYSNISGIDVGLYFEVTLMACGLIVVGGLFMAIAAAYIILAKFSLGLLLALGPAFIVAKLFPASARFFDNWVGQCLNYGLLSALYAAAGAIEVSFATSIMPTDYSVTGVALTWVLFAKIIVSGFVFILISLTLPSLASQLAGGVGISSMVGKVGAAVGGAMNAVKSMGAALSKAGNKAAGGGSIGAA
ncbi:type IV secretion system protein [Burkholderia gladioli]|uniref:type IV secretion system protein n=1 Tax=Burkholderia gladioli TaxID=28095 RepID=UPI001FC9765D|nr:type IV secretion system protein [Burkholderia gladioli]MDN7465807.1 type IV secretion system protein [Burkholderia gladioli]